MSARQHCTTTCETLQSQVSGKYSTIMKVLKETKPKKAHFNLPSGWCEIVIANAVYFLLSLFSGNAT